jgi:hypothetical protein
MGTRIAVLSATLAIATLAAQDRVRYADGAARALMEKSRAAVIDGTPTPIRSLVLRGRLRLPEQETAGDGTVEIKMRLPDRFARVDAIHGTQRRLVVNGRAPAKESADDAVARAQFITLMLGMAGVVPVSDDLVVRSTGEAGFADTAAIDITGPGSYSVRLVLDAASSIPLRVVSFGGRNVSTVISFANRRTVDGYRLPFRVTTQTAERVLEALMFDDVLVNPELREDDFRR